MIASNKNLNKLNDADLTIGPNVSEKELSAMTSSLGKRMRIGLS